jgi:hypothetical protein
VTLLWHLDLIVYHGLLHAAFVAGLVLEEDHPEIPRMRHLMRVNMNGDAAKRVVYFYLGCTAALLLVAVVAIAISAFGDIATDLAVLSVGVATLIAATWLGAMKWLTSRLSTLPGDPSEGWRKRVEKMIKKSPHTPGQAGSGPPAQAPPGAPADRD